MMKLIRFASFVYLLAASFILFYKFEFGLHYRVIAYHLLLITLGLGVLFVVSLLLSFIKWRKLTTAIQYLTAALWGSSLIMLCMAYAVLLIAKMHFDTFITFGMLWGYLASFHSSLQMAGISDMAGYSVCVLLLIVWLGIILYLKGIIPEAISAFKEKMADVIKGRVALGRGLSLLALVCVLVSGAATFYLLHKSSLIDRLFLADEPLTLASGHITYPGHFHFSTAIEPASVRQHYPKNISFNKKNVILIVVDGLRADELSVYGYPQVLDTFVRQMYDEHKLQKVEYAFSTSSSSITGILGMLRSKPSYHLSEYNFSISELLKDQGYQINYILSGDHTNYCNLKHFYGPSIDYYFDGKHTSRFINDDELLLEGLAGVKVQTQVPSFFYFHLMSAHYLGLKHTDRIRFSPFFTPDQKCDPVSYTNSYHNGILQSDHYIKALFARLDSMGYLQNSIVIITADHGESLGERGSYSHIQNVYSEEMRIPLLIYDSDTSVRYDRRHFAEQADIAATIVDRLGLPLPATWEGHSLLRDSFPEFTYHAVNFKYAILHYKKGKIYEYCYDAKNKLEELYEVTSDAHETRDILASTDTVYVSMLRSRMKIFLSEYSNR